MRLRKECVTRLNLTELPALTEFALQQRLFLNWNFYRPHSAHDSLMADLADLLAALREGLAVVEQRLPDYPFLDKLIERSNWHTAFAPCQVRKVGTSER